MYSYKIGSIILFFFCSRLSQNASFCLKASVLFLSTKILVQKPCREVLSQLKRPNTSAKYASLHNHISSNKNSANGSSFLSRSVLFLHGVQIGIKELVLVTAILFLHGEEDDHAANPYFHTVAYVESFRGEAKVLSQSCNDTNQLYGKCRRHGKSRSRANSEY